MFDAKLRPLIDPPLRLMAKAIYPTGLIPNHVTLLGLGIGLLAVPALWLGWFKLALGFILVNRLFDGLDGALARVRANRGHVDSLVGGFLDISADFIFYGAIPLGFALADPNQNALAASFLLSAFLATGTSFLAFSVLAEQHGFKTESRGKKTFFYLGGLAEGTETIACFVLICVLPSRFAVVALIYGLVCWLTVAVRFAEVRNLLKNS